MKDWKEWHEVSPELVRDELPRDQAWRMFSAWKTGAREVGIIFVSQIDRLRAMGIIRSATNGTIQLSIESGVVSFNLTEATFRYGTMPTWPRWPYPPVVEVMALHALLPRGTWLCIAEGLKPDAIPPVALPPF